MIKKHTFCRICEPACPLIARVDEQNKVVALEPDKAHVTEGVACHKGLSYLEIHNDPDRLNWPLKRQNSRCEARGDFKRLSWDDALSGAAEKLKIIRDKHGPNAIAVYLGNPMAFDSRGLLVGGGLADMIGTAMRFSANTQDTANKMTVAGEIYGSSSVITVPDIQRTDYLLCIGSNPKVSRWTLISNPNDGGDVLKQIKARGGKLCFVNPRKTESSTTETGETLRIKPSTDVYFLAAVLNEIDQLGGFDDELVSRHGKNLEGLREFIRHYPADRVAGVTGISVSEIQQVAQDFRAAKSAVCYMSTGVNQGRQGVLSFWLVEMLNFVTGNLGRDGGSYKPNGFIDMYPPMSPDRQRINTSVGELELPEPAGYAVLPGALLADLVKNGDIKAIVTIGGNPVMSIGGEERMRQALERLELMMSVDIVRSATAELSDYVFPATDFLEREDITLLGNGTQPEPYVQYTEAMTEPAFERRDSWWILASLVQRMGLPSPLDAPENSDGFQMINAMLGASELSIEQLRSVPGHTVTLARLDNDTFYGRCVVSDDKKIDCCPEAFTQGDDSLANRAASIFQELSAEPEELLKLISMRTTHMHNSWMANMKKLRKGPKAINPLHMCSRDAQTRGLFYGDEIEVETEYGRVVTRLVVNDDLREGVVAMSHGYGHHRSYALKVASTDAGANYNMLLPTGTGTYEPLSYMSWMCGVPVSVTRLSSS